MCSCELRQLRQISPAADGNVDQFRSVPGSFNSGVVVVFFNSGDAHFHVFFFVAQKSPHDQYLPSTNPSELDTDNANFKVPSNCCTHSLNHWLHRSSAQYMCDRYQLIRGHVGWGKVAVVVQNWNYVFFTKFTLIASLLDFNQQAFISLRSGKLTKEMLK